MLSIHRIMNRNVLERAQPITFTMTCLSFCRARSPFEGSHKEHTCSRSVRIIPQSLQVGLSYEPHQEPGILLLQHELCRKGHVKSTSSLPGSPILSISGESVGCEINRWPSSGRIGDPPPKKKWFPFKPTNFCFWEAESHCLP